MRRDWTSDCSHRGQHVAARVRHVLAHTTVAVTIHCGDGQAERSVWLDTDHEGRVLEVVTINIDDGLLVIHAMDIRPKYCDRYNQVTTSQTEVDLRNNAGEWADYHTDIAKWDVTSGDGLLDAGEEYPECTR